LPDLSVSRQHAAIFTTLEGKWLIEDMDSANRTFLNGEEVQKSELKTGDVIQSINDQAITDAAQVKSIIGIIREQELFFEIDRVLASDRMEREGES